MQIELSVKIPKRSIELNVDVVASYSHEQVYNGPYDVDPTFNQQTLFTNNKYMLDNVNVNPIEVSRVSNPQGGTTVYIGGLLNG